MPSLLASAALAIGLLAGGLAPAPSAVPALVAGSSVSLSAADSSAALPAAPGFCPRTTFQKQGAFAVAADGSVVSPRPSAREFAAITGTVNISTLRVVDSYTTIDYRIRDLATTLDRRTGAVVYAPGAVQDLITRERIYTPAPMNVTYRLLDPKAGCEYLLFYFGTLETVEDAPWCPLPERLIIGSFDKRDGLAVGPTRGGDDGREVTVALRSLPADAKWTVILGRDEVDVMPGRSADRTTITLPTSVLDRERREQPDFENVLPVIVTVQWQDERCGAEEGRISYSGLYAPGPF